MSCHSLTSRAAVIWILAVSLMTGVCQAGPCTDKATNCGDYDLTTACKKPYVSWAKKNCEMTCGYCKSDKGLIVSMINDYRSKVQPPAAGMPKVVWDDGLAKMSQKWADACNYGAFVDPNDESTSNKGIGYGSWSDAVKGWHDPASKFQYGKDPDSYLPGGWYDVGTYIQLVDSNMVRVGCGYSDCNSKKLYTCSFKKSQLYSREREPYVKGTRCSACPKTCKNGLCDCGGLLCSGELNVNTCKCG